MTQPIPEQHKALCAFCGAALDVRDKGVYQWTSGWVMTRTGGGGHGISLPERAFKWACRLCIERAAKGLIAQPSLFS